MNALKVFLVLLTLLIISTVNSYAQSGCCSHHGGVSGCGCADGTALSSTCLPYYPECSNKTNNQQAPLIISTSQITDISTPTVIPTLTKIPAPKKYIVQKKQANNTIKQIPVSLQSADFFSWLIKFLFGSKQEAESNSFHLSSQTGIAGVTTGNSQCKANHINGTDPQAYLPDPNCTPGVINSNITQANSTTTICTAGFTKTIRPAASYTDNLKREQIKEYGYTDTNPHDYEEDHLISLELGGNPSDPKNLWPEPHASLNEKDKVENYLHKQICDGTITLAQAQQKITQNWYAVYLEIK